MQDDRERDALDPEASSEEEKLNEARELLSSEDLFGHPGEPKEPAILVRNASEAAYNEMLKQIRSWGWFSILWGVVSFVGAEFITAWGVSLLMVGALSFLFKEASLFVIYAIVMIGASLQNIFGAGLGLWMVLGFLQLYWSYGLMRKYQAFAPIEKRFRSDQPEELENNRTPNRIFPIGGCLLSGAGILALVGGVILMVVTLLQYAEDGPPETFYTLLGAVLELVGAFGAIGFSVSVAALMAGYERKWMSWIGAILGGLIIAMYISILVLAT